MKPCASTTPPPIPRDREKAYLVSAIVSTYNSERFMRGCLEDLEAQTIADRLEILVIDSCSEQNERAIVDEFQRRHDNIVYIRTARRESVSVAVNRGVRAASGEYLTIANTDDRHRADALEILADALTERPDVGLVYANALITTVPNETFPSNSADQMFNWPDYSLRQALMYSIFGPQPMWRRDLHARVGLFDADYIVANDYNFFLRLAWKHGAYHIPEILGLYLKGPGVELGNAALGAEETHKVLRHYRSTVPLEDIYPALRESSDPRAARGAALCDFANCLMQGIYPDYELAERYYRQALDLLGRDPVALNNLALALYAWGQADQGIALLEPLANDGDPVARQNLEQIRTGPSGRVNVTLYAVSHPVLKGLPKLMPPGATHAPWRGVRPGGLEAPPSPIPRRPGYSFCIISGGGRPEKLARLIESIRSQDIPDCEILVAGISPPREGIICLAMPEAARTGRTSVLRNAAAARSRFDHIVFADDDVVLQPGWFAGLRPYADDYDLLVTRLLNLDGTRHWDWATLGGPRGHVMLDYDESDDHLYLTGGLCVVKAHVWESIRWDERRGYYEGEDVDFSQRALKAGFRVHLCRESVTVHGDERYTQVGRVIQKRTPEGAAAWMSGELMTLKPEELTGRALAEIQKNHLAEAADCLRCCLAKEPACEPARQVWDQLVKACGGPTDEGVWQPHPLLRAPSTAGGPPHPRTAPSPAILWHGPIYDPSGYADEARNFILELQARGFDLAARPIGRHSEKFYTQLDPQTRGRLDQALARQPGSHFINVVHFPAYAFQRVPKAAYHIGRTMFETDGLPAEWVAKCNEMDEVWVPTDFNLRTFREAGVTAKLIKVPEGMDTDRFRPGDDPLPIPGARGTIFLSIFEWIYRKGWDVLLHAWAGAFRPSDDVSLVLRTYPINVTDNADNRLEIERRIDHFLRQGLGLRRDEVAPIIVLGEQVPEEDLPRLYAAVDAYVAPSRGEGWGRPQMQAMACGLPVIATRWSGNLEFMDDENSLLIDIEGLVEIDERAEISFYRGQHWAEPSADHLTALLRRVYERPSEVAKIGLQARRNIVERWRWEQVAGIVAQRLRAIRAELDAPPSPARPAGPVAVRWEGSQFVVHSLALVNRELCIRLAQDENIDLSILPYEAHEFEPDTDPRFEHITRRLNRALPCPAEFHVRHQWPPNFEPPPSGHWVMIQPWEFGRLPKAWVRPMTGEVDEIWVPSAFVRQCYIDSGVPAGKVFVVPNGVNPDLFRPDAQPMDLPTRKSFRFLFVGGTIYRKGIDALLDAYERTFRRSDDVCLVVKDMGQATFYNGQSAAERIRALASDPDAPEVLYLTDPLSDRDVARLYAACHCLVHPYRGEGFGLPVAEAMACGLPVIVTRGGACDDFCSEETARFIPARRVPIAFKEETAGQAWLLEPDREALAARMRWAVEHPGEAKAMGARASAFIRANVTWERTAGAVQERLRALKGKPILREKNRAAQHLTAAETAEAAGDLAGAVEAARKATAVAPAWARTHNDLGRYLYRSGDVAAARAAFERAAQAEPALAEAHSNLGVLLWETGQQEEALEAFERAAQADPENVDLLYNLGAIYAQIGDAQRATAFFERCLTLRPDDAGVRAQLDALRAAD